MPRIGPRTGARILAEIGDGSAFASGVKLAAYAGLAPVTRQSGTSLNTETRSRRGNHRTCGSCPLPATCSIIISAFLCTARQRQPGRA
ncbi:MAG TPA: transposase [Trebonia sp.]